MDRIRQNRDGNGGRLMNSHAYQRAWPLLIALALILVDASILRGERDPDDMVFETPTINTNPVAAAAAAAAADYAASKKAMTQNTSTPAAPERKRNGSTIGKATISQANIAKTAKPLRKPIPASQPQLPASNANSITSSPPPAYSLESTKSANRSGVVQASHQLDPPAGITRDGADPLLVPPHGRRNQVPPVVVMSPMNKGAPPPIHGAYFGLIGETATERLYQMQSMKLELEQENELLRQQNAGLQTRVKETQDQLMAAVREIQAARKEIVTARNDLDRLRGELQSLREKVRAAEKEHTGFLQSMGPLLQQLLESTDVGALPPNPTE